MFVTTYHIQTRKVKLRSCVTNNKHTVIKRLFCKYRFNQSTFCSFRCYNGISRQQRTRLMVYYISKIYYFEQSSKIYFFNLYNFNTSLNNYKNYSTAWRIFGNFYWNSNRELNTYDTHNWWCIKQLVYAM